MFCGVKQCRAHACRLESLNCHSGFQGRNVAASRPEHLRLEQLETRMLLAEMPTLYGIFADACEADPLHLSNVNSTLFFAANNGANGVELWKSTAFGPGTIFAADINSGAGSSNPAFLASTATTLYFAASDGASGTELWTLSNPTSGGGGAAAALVFTDANKLPSDFPARALIASDYASNFANRRQLVAIPRRGAHPVRGETTRRHDIVSPQVYQRLDAAGNYLVWRGSFGPSLEPPRDSVVSPSELLHDTVDGILFHYIET